MPRRDSTSSQGSKNQKKDGNNNQKSDTGKKGKTRRDSELSSLKKRSNKTNDSKVSEKLKEEDKEQRDNLRLDTTDIKANLSDLLFKGVPNLIEKSKQEQEQEQKKLDEQKRQRDIEKQKTPKTPINLSGSLKVFKNEPGVAVHFLNDEDFQEVYNTYYTEQERNEAENAVIAVFDTGIIRNERDFEVGSKVKAAKDFSKNAEEKYDDVAIEDPHGSLVAGQAVFGTEKIELLDARIQKQSPSPADDSYQQRVVEAIDWAVENGAKIITASVQVPWEKDIIKQAIEKYPDVYFIETAGNNQGTFKERTVRHNKLLVGGTTTKGERHRQRGVGAKAVDVMVPSATEIDDARGGELNLLIPFRFNTSDNDRPDNRKTTLAVGVSFGLPVVANMIAKMLLIHPNITPEELYNIVVHKAVQKITALEGLSRSNGMIDPKKAYLEAANLLKAYRERQSNAQF